MQIPVRDRRSMIPTRTAARSRHWWTLEYVVIVVYLVAIHEPEKRETNSL